jgi:hypothetical protein
MEAEEFVERQRNEFVRRIEQDAKLRHARHRLKERPMMIRAEERMIVGLNMWNLLEEVEQRGIRKSHVLGKSKETFSTKHLPRYALRPEIDLDRLRHRARDLIKTASKYVEIARIAAGLAGIDPDEAELRVLEGTHYLRDLPDTVFEEDQQQRAQHLEVMLAHIAERVTARHGLAPLVKRMDDRRWSLRDGCRDAPMVVAPLASSERGFGTGPIRARHLPSDDDIEVADWLARYPQLHLGFVKAPFKGFREIGYVVGSATFVQDGSTRHRLEFRPLPVRLVTVHRIDLVLRSKPAGNGLQPVISDTVTTWIKPLERLIWADGDGNELAAIEVHETLGELHGAVDRPHFSGAEPRFGFGRRVKEEQRTTPEGSWSTDLVLLSDDSGQPLDGGDIDRMSLDPGFLGLVSPEVRSVCYPLGDGETGWLLDQPRAYRSFAAHPCVFGHWTDERKEGTPYLKHPLNALDALDEPILEPVTGPTGSLSAFIEYWLAGRLRGAWTLEQAFDNEATAFVRRIATTEAEAQTALMRAVYAVNGEGQVGRP